MTAEKDKSIDNPFILRKYTAADVTFINPFDDISTYVTNILFPQRTPALQKYLNIADSRIHLFVQFTVSLFKCTVFR